ncbi:GntR family transcriptional regulator [Paraburkholderia sediminicola]|uniref:GntR family transcriptional regulator n=1 Tax=Paraburkholderia sediminicola TaxID=458836 RepID=UPI0038B7A871
MNSLRYLNVISQRGSTCSVIVAALETAIRTGQIRAGEVLPSQRLMADFMGVHLNTVNRAMREAASRGLTTARTRRGTTVIARPKT